MQEARAAAKASVPLQINWLSRFLPWFCFPFTITGTFWVHGSFDQQPYVDHWVLLSSPSNCVSLRFGALETSSTLITSSKALGPAWAVRKSPYSRLDSLNKKCYCMILTLYCTCFFSCPFCTSCQFRRPGPSLFLIFVCFSTHAAC